MSDLDLRKFNLQQTGIRSFTYKRDAAVAVKSHLGTSGTYVRSAANRFWKFWTIVRKEQSGRFSILRNDGTFLEIDDVSWVGSRTYSNA